MLGFWKDIKHTRFTSGYLGSGRSKNWDSYFAQIRNTGDRF